MAGSAHDATSHVADIGLCTECHTPHKAKTTSLLWNHSLSTNTFSWDDPQTTAGTPYPKFAGNTYSGPTAKCMSCHDGTLFTSDKMWYKEAYTTGTFAIGMFGTGVALISGPKGDMSGNHPVAMPYPYNNALNTYNGSKNGPSTVLDEWVSDPTVQGIRLFQDDTGAGGHITAGVKTGFTGMECSSCHDVHNGKRVKDDFLLTGLINGTSSAAGGYICVQCHKK